MSLYKDYFKQQTYTAFYQKSGTYHKIYTKSFIYNIFWRAAEIIQEQQKTTRL